MFIPRFCIYGIGFAVVMMGEIMKIRSNVNVFGLLAMFIGLFAMTASAQNRTVLAEAERISGDSFTFTARTAMGANVYGVSRPTKKTLDAIDAGLTELFAVARKNRYKKRLNYSDYTIYVAKADRTKDFQNNYSPDIAIGAAQYAGSVYDKGGFIYAAGIVVALDPCAFMIAEHTKDFQRVSEAVRNEGEHLVLYQNDRKRFAETSDHSKGGGHPILQ